MKTTYWMQRNATDWSIMSIVVLNKQVRSCIPHLNASVGAARHDATVLLVKRDGVYRADRQINAVVKGIEKRKPKLNTTYSVWSKNVWMFWWDSTSHNLTVLSSEPLTAIELSVLNFALRTQLLCPTKELWNFLVGKDQILIDLSSEPVRRWQESEEKSTDRTAPVCPFNTTLSPRLYRR